MLADGVETDARRDFLLANGCQWLQGYPYARPMPIEEWDEGTDTA